MQDGIFTILIVEDDPNDVLFVKRALSRNGISNPVQVAVDGDEAIHYLSGSGKFSDRSQYPFPGFVLLDLKMPRKGGLEVLQWLKEHPEFMVIPTIVFTSSKEEKDIKDAYCLGANSYVVKPVSFDDLQEVIRRVYDYWQVCEKPDVQLDNPCNGR